MTTVPTTTRVDRVVDVIGDEISFLDRAIALCDWRFEQLTALESRRAALAWTLALLYDGPGA